ncbi:MAG: endonuclease/exonuclease/phosphatase family protein [Anaerolineae bacterium]|nr:endonuclease/exonuclease/phosphatase family protein [Anaerolineae bacterium]
MTSVTIATINLRNRADRWRQRRHLLVAQLLDTTPDLLALQEISFAIGQGRWLRNQINARLPEGKRPYALVQKRKQHWRYRGEGVGILTNLPVVYADYVNLSFNGRLALRANIILPDHQTLDFVTTHLHHVAHDREARQEQALRLVGWLRNIRPTPLQVIAGDFNETPDGPATQVMKQSFRSVYEMRHGREPLATFPTALGSSTVGDWAGCLDYIFVTPTITRISQAAIFCDKPAPDDDTLYPSDHVGLIATLEL